MRNQVCRNNKMIDHSAQIENKNTNTDISLTVHEKRMLTRFKPKEFTALSKLALNQYTMTDVCLEIWPGCFKKFLKFVRIGIRSYYYPGSYVKF